MGKAQLAKSLFSKVKGAVGSGKGSLADLLQSGVTGATIKQIKGDPGLYGPIAAGGALFGAGLGAPVAAGFVDQVRGTSRKAEQRHAEFMREDRIQRTLREAEIERLRQAMLQSAARLAAVDPQLYNQVLAGRRLPQGAAVFGGQPRVDLLEQLAYDMATGAYNEPDAQSDLSALLGA